MNAIIFECYLLTYIITLYKTKSLSVPKTAYVFKNI
jgi:hypothetical protein